MQNRSAGGRIRPDPNQARLAPSNREFAFGAKRRQCGMHSPTRIYVGVPENVRQKKNFTMKKLENSLPLRASLTPVGVYSVCLSVYASPARLGWAFNLSVCLSV